MLEQKAKSEAGTGPAMAWEGAEPVGLKPGEMAIHEEAMVPEMDRQDQGL